jgi:hypothetical protein
MRHPGVFSLVYTCKGMPDPAAIPPMVKKRSWHRRKSRTYTWHLEQVVGRKEWGLKTAAGENVWDFLNLTAHLADRPEPLRPMLSYGGRGGWNWKPIGEFLKVLADTKQPVISEGTWGAVNPPGLKNPGAGRSGLNVYRDRPIPVFTGYSGDYQGGRNGDGGATNYGVWWDYSSIVDEADRFEIVITGRGKVDVTPRRMQKFIVKPGEVVGYDTKFLSGRRRRKAKPVSGQARADEHGLVTVPGVLLTGRTQLILTRPEQ